MPAEGTLFLLVLASLTALRRLNRRPPARRRRIRPDARGDSHTGRSEAARMKGKWGERRVQTTIGRRLNYRTYPSLHDLTLPTPDGTTQVDHVVVSRFGIFVIETKNLS